MPEPGNPQALNRYSYVLNNPLRYTDSTGHFTDDAIRAYLQSMYGNEWHSYWDAWSADQAWMNLLLAAEGGDIMTRASLDDGNLSLEHFLLTGSGQDLLSGVYQVSQLTSSPSVNTSLLLHELYVNQGQGMVIFRFIDGIDLVAQSGHVGVALRPPLGRDDIRYRGVVLWSLIFAFGKINPWLGAGLGFTRSVFSPEIAEWPGMQPGDTQLTLGLALDLEEYTRVWTYQTYFRNGTNLDNEVFGGITVFDRPKEQLRRN